jgi:hypothetical protein
MFTTQTLALYFVWCRVDASGVHLPVTNDVLGDGLESMHPWTSGIPHVAIREARWEGWWGCHHPEHFVVVGDLGKIGRCLMSEGTGDENGRKRSVNTKNITIFIFFIGNKIENDNSGNGNDIGISETSKTKVRCGKYTDNGRNLKYDR